MLKQNSMSQRIGYATNSSSSSSDAPPPPRAFSGASDIINGSTGRIVSCNARPRRAPASHLDEHESNKGSLNHSNHARQVQILDEACTAAHTPSLRAFATLARVDNGDRRVLTSRASVEMVWVLFFVSVRPRSRFCVGPLLRACACACMTRESVAGGYCAGSRARARVFARGAPAPIRFPCEPARQGSAVEVVRDPDGEGEDAHHARGFRTRSLSRREDVQLY